MDHRLSSEAFNQNYTSRESCVSNGSQQTARVRRQRVSEPCPGSQPANPERIYVLKNSDLCPDYTLSHCQENQCPTSYCSCSGSCPSRSTNCSGLGPSHSADYSFSESVCGEKIKPKKPPSPLPDQKQQAKRRTGGTNEICPLCGQMEIFKPDQKMCSQCNERIHTAVNNYLQSQYEAKEEPASHQCSSQGNQNGQPANGQWQQPNIVTGDPNLNVIVLQDCQNKQELFDQLSMAMNRNAGQVQNPQSPPGYQNNNYYQNNANKCQNTNANNYQNTNTNNYQNNPTNNYKNNNTNNYQNTNTNNYQNNPTNNYENTNTNNYQNSPPNNYQNNPPACYNDYEYVDYSRNYEHPEPYDCRYDVSPGQCRSPCPGQVPSPCQRCYSEGGFDDFRCSCRTPCSSSFDCQPRENQCRCQEESYESFLDQDADPSCGCTCTCNCEFCRKGFESKEKLAMLIAHALEIFIEGYQERKDKRDKRDKPAKKKQKKKGQKEGRKTAGSTEVQPEVPPLWKSKPPRPRRAPESRSSDRSYCPRRRFHPLPQIHVLTQVHEPTPAQAEKQAPKKTNSSVNAKSNSQVNLNRLCSKQKAAKEPTLPMIESSNAEQKNSNSPIFFLPNSGDELRSSHDFGDGSWARSCAKCGDGDSRRRRRARRRNRYQNRYHPTEWNQCQREGEYRRWQKGSNGCSLAGQIKPPGGGKNSAVLLGLSPIAHYRPGMMKFPVNYLLAGTNYRRSLVRTAAGVTLHQKPYMDKDEVKDLPSFPRQKESSHLDCRMPPPAKKWL